MFQKYFYSITVVLFTVFSIFGQDGIPEAPTPPRLVNNLSKAFPDFLSQGEEDVLEQKLEKFAAETSNQIVIVIVDDLAGYEPSDFAIHLGEKWGVGQNKLGNGVVVLIKPSKNNGGRKEFIAVGKGLEGAIPDAISRQIENNELLPNLKKGNFYQALDQTTDVLMELAKGEYNSKDYAKKINKDAIQKVIIVVIIIVLIIIFLFGRKGGNGGRGGYTMGSGGIFFGGMGMGSGFGGGGSSSGGGGFGGFGGGGFGGGGSGGSW